MQRFREDFKIGDVLCCYDDSTSILILDVESEDYKVMWIYYEFMCEDLNINFVERVQKRAVNKFYRL